MWRLVGDTTPFKVFVPGCGVGDFLGPDGSTPHQLCLTSQSLLWSLPLTIPFAILFLQAMFKVLDGIQENIMLHDAIAGEHTWFFKDLIEVVALTSHAMGHQARWHEGCSCHETLLLGHSRKRKRAIQQESFLLDDETVGDTEHGLCCWKGKRGPLLAPGHWQ